MEIVTTPLIKAIGGCWIYWICETCSRFVDMAWLPDPAFTAEAIDRPIRKCPDCCIAGTSDRRLATMAATDFARMRGYRTHLYLGAGGSDPLFQFPPLVAKALGEFQMLAPTLFFYMLDGRPKGIAIASFSVAGFCSLHPDELRSRFSNLPNPVFSSEVLDGDGDRITIAYVRLGLALWHPHRPESPSLWRWRFEKPAAGYQLKQEGLDDLTNDEAITLKQVGESCLLGHVLRRESGPTIGREQYLRAVRAEIMAHDGRCPKQEDFFERNPTFSLRTFKRHRRQLNLGSWRELCAEATASAEQ